MEMGKTVEKIKDTFLSFGEAAPIIGGASLGLIVPTTYGYSPVQELVMGHYNQAASGLIRNYTFYNDQSGHFELSQGIGTKGLLAGFVVSKVINWVRNQ